MGKMLVFVLMACVVSASCHIIDRTLWPASTACREYHLLHWESAAQENSGFEVDRVRNLYLTYDASQYDKEFILRNNDTTGLFMNTDFYFDLYKTRAGEQGPLKDRHLERLLHNERPKLNVTRGSSKTEYALKHIEVDFPYEIYDNDNHSPDYVNVEFHFATTNFSDPNVVIIFPVYGADDAGVRTEDHIGSFLRSLLWLGREAYATPFLRDLKLVKPALESLNTNAAVYLNQGYSSTDYVITAPCEYTDKEIFQPLYEAFHATPRR